METRVLLAGTTGYLGKYILEQLIIQGCNVKALARDPKRVNTQNLKLKDQNQLQLIKAEVTQPNTLVNCCQDIDVVITCVGITRQKDGLKYMDVDYQANMNILNEAKLSKTVKKFIYVSAFNGDKIRNVKIMEAKEKFVDEVKLTQNMDYCIVRPTGFFSDMKDFLDMAKDGRVYLFGNGQLKMNPIHGEDLATEIVKRINIQEKIDFDIGGPEVFTQQGLGECALRAWGKNIKITKFCDCLRKWTICCLRTCTSEKTYGPPEFFLTAMGEEMEAPCYGKIKLQDFFNKEVKIIKEQERKNK